MGYLRQNDATRAAIETGYRFSHGLVESRLLLETPIKAGDRLEAWLESWPTCLHPPHWA
ncbi:MAG: hypothetical protein GX442_23610 [Candidatus Riflebacteria bacterium]|nr:hypothetical protein [Candidatus Riflebacteria bacterium]